MVRSGPVTAQVRRRCSAAVMSLQGAVWTNADAIAERLPAASTCVDHVVVGADPQFSPRQRHRGRGGRRNPDEVCDTRRSSRHRRCRRRRPVEHDRVLGRRALGEARRRGRRLRVRARGGRDGRRHARRPVARSIERDDAERRALPAIERADNERGGRRDRRPPVPRRRRSPRRPRCPGRWIPRPRTRASAWP